MSAGAAASADARADAREPSRASARAETGAPHVPAPLLFVTGGKGGVGKSTLAANLAVALARSGRAVLLVDLDLGLANLDVMLGAEPRARVEDLFAGRRTTEECLVEGPAGVRLLAASSGSPELALPDAGRRARLLREVARLAAHHDFVIGDGAAGIGGDVLGFAAAAERVLVVTTPEPAALADAYGTIKALDRHARDAGLEVPTPDVVVNQAVGFAEAQRAAEGLRATAERFLARSPRFAGWLPRSRGVQAATRARRPFVLDQPGSPAARELRRLASRLAAPAAAPALKPSVGHGR